MSATDFLPRCKYKKNLANDVHCEPYFLQKYAFFLIFPRFSSSFIIKNFYSSVWICTAPPVEVKVILGPLQFMGQTTQISPVPSHISTPPSSPVWVSEQLYQIITVPWERQLDGWAPLKQAVPQVQSAITIVSIPKNASNNVIRFISFKSLIFVLQRQGKNIKNGRNSATISSILR